MADDGGEFETEADAGQPVQGAVSGAGSAEQPEDPADIFAGSIVQSEMSADDAYWQVVAALKAEYPNIEYALAADQRLAQKIYGHVVEELG
jgi:hypothetical protein